jgi:hypothetical protein
MVAINRCQMRLSLLEWILFNFIIFWAITDTPYFIDALCGFSPIYMRDRHCHLIKITLSADFSRYYDVRPSLHTATLTRHTSSQHQPHHTPYQLKTTHHAHVPYHFIPSFHTGTAIYKLSIRPGSISEIPFTDYHYCKLMPIHFNNIISRLVWKLSNKNSVNSNTGDFASRVKWDENSTDVHHIAATLLFYRSRFEYEVPKIS